MCPDHQIISLYLDGELPSPWKEKMETHLESCPGCKNVFAGYRSLGEHLQSADTGEGAFPSDGAILAARDRVWKKITAQTAAVYEQEVFKPKKRVWNRSITLPLPAAAAAALIIIFAFYALAGIRGRSQPEPQNSMAAAGIGLDDFGTVPMQDMNGLLQYLSSQDNGDFMIIRLPESKRFSPAGEPALINAADYSRTRRSFSR